MKAKPLWKISLLTLPDAEGAVSELLSETFQQPAASYTDAESGETTVTVYLDQKPERQIAEKALISGLKRIKTSGIEIGIGRYSLQKVRREDWAESWKRHFKPIEIGDALLVRPSWSRQRAKQNQAVVILDPGLSFGTGQHPTTGFCLRQIATNRKRRTTQSFLDVGTGSGILAIAAAKLGYSPVEAFDFDPEAVRIAGANAKRNRLLNKVQIRQADATKLPRRPKRRYSLVCANLISTLLVSERDRLVAALATDGVLVLAGILASEFPVVQQAFEGAGLDLIASRVENEWRSGAFAFAKKNPQKH